MKKICLITEHLYTFLYHIIILWQTLILFCPPLLPWPFSVFSMINQSIFTWYIGQVFKILVLNWHRNISCRVHAYLRAVLFITSKLNSFHSLEKKHVFSVIEAQFTSYISLALSSSGYWITWKCFRNQLKNIYQFHSNIWIP